MKVALALSGICLFAVCACQSSDEVAVPVPALKPQEAPPPEVAAPTTPTVRPPRAQFATQLWDTKLGQMYKFYLFTESDREALPAIASQIVNKILSDTNQTIALISALQMMNEDLYIKGRIGEDTLGRIALLEQEISKGRHDVEKSHLNFILAQIPFFFIATVPIGSPLFRSEMVRTVRGHVVLLISWMRLRQSPGSAAVQWNRIFSKEFFTNYQIGRPLDAFMKTAIPITIAEWFHEERKFDGSAEGLSQGEIEKSANR